MQGTAAEEMEGVEATSMEIDTAPLMTEQERRVLDVYDRLEEHQLEIALLKARGVLSQGIYASVIFPTLHRVCAITCSNPSLDEPVEATEEDIKAAEQELLKAKAKYQVRNNVIESVLIANPILKAVHAGSNATILEQ
jgi:hypothetical protein